MTAADAWKLLAGVAIFLLGMNLMEGALKHLAGRPFKLFLRRQTAHPLRAIAGGAVVTGVLQSSSVVNLMVLAFVGSGVINMHNALAVMLGSNLGTTLDSWIVATLGFKFNIESIAYPITAIAGIGAALFAKETNWQRWSHFLLGFGFLFVGLGYMRAGIEASVLQFNLAGFSHYPAIFFLLIGFIITSLIQSSSATIAITLSALHANAITLTAAAAIVLGAEIGTTVKLLLASAGGDAAKKRVALGNFLFNSITTLLVLLFIRYVLQLITHTIGITDPLIALVFFQSFVNITGILLFFPFLKSFGRYLENRFRNNDEKTGFISKVPVAETELAMDALEKETLHFLQHTARFSTDTYDISTVSLPTADPDGNNHSGKPILQYEYIKHLHGDILAYYLQLQKQTSTQVHTQRLDQLITAVRNGMYAAKSLKDSWHDATQLKQSANDVKYQFYLQLRRHLETFYNQLLPLLHDAPQHNAFALLTTLYNTLQENYNHDLAGLYREGFASQLSETEISTLLNFNREVYTSMKSMILAVKDYHLNETDAAHFDELPGFIR